jgi:hypothetical protein
MNRHASKFDHVPYPEVSPFTKEHVVAGFLPGTRPVVLESQLAGGVLKITYTGLFDLYRKHIASTIMRHRGTSITPSDKLVDSMRLLKPAMEPVLIYMLQCWSPIVKGSFEPLGRFAYEIIDEPYDVKANIEKAVGYAEELYALAQAMEDPTIMEQAALSGVTFDEFRASVTAAAKKAHGYKWKEGVPITQGQSDNDTPTTPFKSKLAGLGELNPGLDDSLTRLMSKEQKIGISLTNLRTVYECLDDLSGVDDASGINITYPIAGGESVTKWVPFDTLADVFAEPLGMRSIKMILSINPELRNMAIVSVASRITTMFAEAVKRGEM